MLRLLLTIAVSGCTMTAKTPSSPVKQAQSGPWYQGSVEEGLQFAAANDRPVMIYWGAVWCPPCAEIKSQVFEHHDFNQLMSQVVGIYIDGDAADAQTYGDQFKISGYPTILILSAAGEEIMRIDHGTSFEEFALALRSALQTSTSLQDLVAKLRREEATPEEWARVAYQYGGDLSDDKEEELRASHHLFSRCPAQLPKVKSRLAAQFLQMAASFNPEQRGSDTWATVSTDFPKALAQIFSTQEARIAARGVLLYSATGILKLFPDEEQDEWRAKWLRATNQLAVDEDLSIDSRLWAVYPRIQFFREIEGDNAAIPNALKSDVIQAVKAADRRATTTNDRKAVISGAAYLLRLVGEVDAARELLRKELVMTKTPWYYHSSLASLEEKAGNREAALRWSAKARESAEGNATRLQWTVDDLRLTAKVVDDTQLPRVEKLVQAYYNLAFSLPDGFSGRNALRARLVANALEPWMDKPALIKTIARYAGNCSSLAGEQKTRCLEHFAKLTGPKS